MQIIDHLLRLDGLEIELCGRWLWISGNTKPHKEELKAWVFKAFPYAGDSKNELAAS